MELNTRDLRKKMKFKIDKDGDHISRIRVKLEYDPTVYPKEANGPIFDADLTIAMLEDCGTREDGSVRRNIYAEDPRYVVFYGNEVTLNEGTAQERKVLKSPNDEVIHTGDDRLIENGETAEIYLDRMDSGITEIAIVGSIHRGVKRRQCWKDLNAKLILENMDTNEIIAQVNLSDRLPDATAVHFVSIYRDAEGQWQVESIEVGYESGLEPFLDFWQS